MLLDHFSNGQDYSPAIVDLLLAKNKWGMTPLHVCVVEYNYDAFSKLILHFDDILDYNMRDNLEYSALHYAAFDHKFARFLTILAQSPRVDTNAQTKSGLTPLHIAVINKNYYGAMILVSCPTWTILGKFS